jgi:hypothetical protein
MRGVAHGEKVSCCQRGYDEQGSVGQSALFYRIFATRRVPASLENALERFQFPRKLKAL